MNLELKYPPHSIATYSGKVFDIENLTEDMICIEDIAHALSNTARFGGHTDVLYSVAQHSVEVSLMVNKEHQLAALLHDASEAYIGDMPSPLKSLLPEFKEMEDKIMKVVASKFDFQYPFDPAIKDADKKALDIEMDMIYFKNIQYKAMNPKRAKEYFMRYFNFISGTNTK